MDELLASADLEQVSRDSLVDSRGTTYKAFRRTLAPRWGIVWRDIALGHAALLLSVLFLIHAQGFGLAGQLAALAAGALAIGYAVAFLLLFLHEAAHYNIAPTRGTNDRLANLCIGVLAGQDIEAYRPIHFDHHRHLGTPRDTERTYFDALDVRFVLEACTGIKALKVLRVREGAAGGEPASDKRSLLNPQLVLGLLLHAGVLGAALLAGCWVLAGAWLIGMGAVFPFCAALRQLLEHRAESARPDVDYRRVPHGAVNRVFGDGPLASTFGGAGFNRHLLHHWDPQLSYTQLRAVERFLLDTHAQAFYRAHQTTYLATFARLFAAGSRRAPSIELAP